MDRLNQIRGEAGSSRDPTLDTTSPPSEAYMTANESSSKYFSLSEVDSTFSISPSKDASTTNADSDRAITVNSELISNLSPIPKKSDLDSYKIGKQIEAANILSGGVNIFEDNDNSYDGDELVIDDNAIDDEKGNELKLESTELPLEKNLMEEPLMSEETEIPSKDTEVVLQIDGKNVDAIDIGNGLYLYRKAGQEELAAVQIIDDDQQQPSFKFLKVRENTEGNLEVYEEIEIEIPKEVPIKEGKQAEKTSHVPIKDISKVINEPSSNKIADKVNKAPKNDNIINDLVSENVESEFKTEVNLNGKMMKFNEFRKSPLIGTYTPMTYHSTPNKEGIPLTKTMVDQQLHPSRHSDNVKKTIEVHTESCRQKNLETPTKSNKDSTETPKTPEAISEQEKMDIESELSEATVIPDAIAVKDFIITEKEITDEGKTIIIEDTTTDITKPDASESDMKSISIENTTDTQPIQLDKSEVTKSLNEKQNLPNATTVENKKLSEGKEIIENKNTQINIEYTSMDISNENKNDDEIIVIGDEEIVNIDHDKNDKSLQAVTVDENKDILLKQKANLELEAVNIDNYENKEKNSNVIEGNNILNDLNHTKPDHSSDVFVDKSSLSNISDETEISSKGVAKTSTESEKAEDQKNHTEENEILDSTNTDVPINVNEKVLPENADIIKVPKNKDLSQEGNAMNSFKEDIRDISNDNVGKKKEIEIKVAQKEVKERSSVNNSILGNIVHIKETVPQTISSNYVREKHDSYSSTSKEISPNPIPPKAVCELITDLNKKLIETKKEMSKPKTVPPKAINNNSAVPFGKWTEANRQEFLNKIKTKIPSNNPSTKQLKQPNDLNRRDVLKKIDSQRQSATGLTKITDFGNMSKINTKVETTAFVNKPIINQQVNNQEAKTIALKTNTMVKQKPIVKKVHKEETASTNNITVKPPQRKEINNQDLIDKTIEGIINRAVTGKNTGELIEEKTVKVNSNKVVVLDSLDDIEKKMNELHGIPFEERSAHEMSQIIKNETKRKSKPINSKNDKSSKIPSLVAFKISDKNVVKEKISEEPSDEEIIEHEPITGDIEMSKQNLVSILSSRETSVNEPSKEAIITEKEFDKFARRNSITYENCLTMSFDGKEPHNVIQTLVQKEAPVKKLSRNELMLAESKAKSASKQQILLRHNNQINKGSNAGKVTNVEDTLNKNYQSKVQMAYQSVMTAKQNSECPVTIIEDKPVKVVYVDTDIEYAPMQTSVQGKELSPSKKQAFDSSDAIYSASESLDSSDTLDSHNDIKPQDETKLKSKHQRKQVLTPVEEPELELIEPRDLGIDVSPKKKRKLDDKNEKIKNLVPKKSYLLNRSVIDEEVSKPQDVTKKSFNDTSNRSESFKSHTDTISAIDNLVKAAELIETQAEKKNTVIDVSNSSLDNSVSTPIKRGRGRPRKYPIPEQSSDVKAPSPQKKPRLIDAKVIKNYTDSDDSSDSEIIKENWTMGKINENIVCPICNKLFRSENVVFKHVKHCTGPSPNRSDSDQRSPMRLRRSTGRKSRDSTSDFTDEDEEKIEKLRSRKSRHYFTNYHDDVIIIEDTPIKEKPQKLKVTEAKKNVIKPKIPPTTQNLICEFCGKTFRQLSYLVSHKMQHKKEDLKSTENETTKTVFSCEVCKKEFRKLHHLVQHRLIHNQIPSRLHRKSSSEQHDVKSSKSQGETKQTDDTSAGFRCEPCDKSFRKLHHLVEHRETHDGINKKGTSTSQSANETNNKSSHAYNCDVCKKVFKKLQDYLEHKELHMETSSEKSDDKSVKSSLSTKDIIHECSLCYMVFPNEHSLNKHTIICLKKKKQSAAKEAAKRKEEESAEAEGTKSDINPLQDMMLNEHCQEIDDSDVMMKLQNDSDNSQQKEEIDEKVDTLSEEVTYVIENKTDNVETKSKKLSCDKESSEELKPKINESIEIPVKTEKITIKEYITIPDTPTLKKKSLNKEKITPSVTKRHKTVIITLPVVDDSKPTAESSDDDDVRYMLNPNFKDDECSEAKIFMKVRAKKRNSLQIERPNSKDLIKRRISLQHPPKIPRLKAKAVEPKPVNSLAVEKRLKLSKPEPINTDSDDSDVKYSFPVIIPHSSEATLKEDKKSKRHSIAVKRKSLSGIAKRKSLGKHKMATPTNKIKKRTTEAEHRCDCGQLFSSAALLSRHTTLAHTPPRIRRRRSPPPDDIQTKDKPQKKPQTSKTKFVPLKKIKSDATNSKSTTIGVGTRKSSVNNTDGKITNGKSIACEPIGKVLRSAAHRGVPVPEKMRKLMEKSKK